VPVLIFSVRGQWDSVCFALLLGSVLALRREGHRAAFLAGLLFVLAAIAKPVAVPLALFFLERKRLGSVVGGMTACFLAWLAVLWWIGDPLTIGAVDHVLRYARGGVTYFGAPFALGVKQNRLFVLLPLLALLPLYALRRIAREEAILIFYVFTIATCGLSAQYLVWAVPFLLMCGHDRFAALYSLVAGVFLVTFYVSPFGGFLGYNFENLAAFAPLRELIWLTPPITDARLRLEIVRTLGDIVLPVLCAAFLLMRLWQLRRRKANEAPTERDSLAPLAVGLTALAAMVTLAWSMPKPPPEVFARRMETKVQAYNVELYQPPAKALKPAWVVPLGARPHPFVATNLAYLWVAVWCAVAAAPRLTRRAARFEASVNH
jgi:hypothetical protein